MQTPTSILFRRPFPFLRKKKKKKKGVTLHQFQEPNQFNFLLEKNLGARRPLSWYTQNNYPIKLTIYVI